MKPSAQGGVSQGPVGTSQASALKERYWAFRLQAGRFASLFAPSNRGFASVVASDLVKYAAGVRPVAGDTWERAIAAYDWLARAQDAMSDGGVAYGYFPCDVPGGWKRSYPETTGYIITSLLEFARRTGSSEARARAVRMARWEAAVQMPSGAVQGGIIASPDKQTPAAFNTGMVLDGWTSVLAPEREPAILAAARRAADFLVNDLSKDGYFRTNGQFVGAETIKVYNVLCAWALYRFGALTGSDGDQRAAIRAVEAAVRQQRSNGWFANNCLDQPETPLTHTIGYTLQGILEVGLLAGRDDIVDAAIRGATPLADAVRPNGFLAGRFQSNWQPAVSWVCLTGSAQFAIVCYRLAQTRGQRALGEAADRIVDFLKGVQVTRSADSGVVGALAGSFPIFGGYQTGGYPNWATKYFLDALMLQAEARGIPAPDLSSGAGRKI
jgi:hypothetical protein